MQQQFKCSCPRLSFAAVIDSELCVSASLKNNHGSRVLSKVSVTRCYSQNNDIASFLSELNKSNPLLASISSCQQKCRYQSKKEYASNDRSASDVLNQLLSVLFENDQLAFCVVEMIETDGPNHGDAPSSSSQPRLKCYDGLLQVLGKSSAILHIDINNVNGPIIRKRDRSVQSITEDTPTETKTHAKRVTPSSGVAVGTPSTARRSSTTTSEDSYGLNDADADLDSIGSGSCTNLPTLYSLCQKYLRPDRRQRAPSTPVNSSSNTSGTNNVSSTESFAPVRGGMGPTAAPGGLQRSASLSQLAVSSASVQATRQPSLDSKDTPIVGLPLKHPKKISASLHPGSTKTTPPLASSSGTSSGIGNNSSSSRSRLPSRGEIQRKALPLKTSNGGNGGNPAISTTESVSAAVDAVAEHRRRKDHHIRGELRRLNSSPSIQMLDLSQQSTLTGGSVVSYRSDSSVGSAAGYESSDAERATLVDTGSESERDTLAGSRRGSSSGIALTPSAFDSFNRGIKHSNAAFYDDKTPQPCASNNGGTSSSDTIGAGNRLSFDEQAMQTPVRGGATSPPVSSGCGGIALLNSRDMAFLNEIQPDTSFELEAADPEGEEERYYSEDADFDKAGGYFPRDSDDFQLTEGNLERFNEDDMLEYSKSSFSRQFASTTSAGANRNSQTSAVLRKSKSFSSVPSLLPMTASPVLSDGSRRGIGAGYQSDETSNLFPDLLGSGSKLSRVGGSKLDADSLAYSRSNAAGSRQLLPQSASPQGSSRPAGGGGLFGFVAKAPTLGEMSGHRQVHSPAAASSPVSESHARLLDQVTTGTPEIAVEVVVDKSHLEQAVQSLSEENTLETILMDVDSLLAQSEGSSELRATSTMAPVDEQQQFSFAMKPPVGKHQRTSTENSRTSDEHSHMTAASASSTKTGATTSSLEASRGPSAVQSTSGPSSISITAVPRQVDARLKVYETALNKMPTDLSALLSECILWQKVYPVDCALQIASHLLSLTDESLKVYQTSFELKKIKAKKNVKSAEVVDRLSLLDGVTYHLVKKLSQLLEERMGTFVDGVKAYGACAVLIAVFQMQYFTSLLRSKEVSVESLKKQKTYRKLAESFEFALDKSLLSFGSWCLSPADRLWIVSSKTASASDSAAAGVSTTTTAGVEKDRRKRQKSEESMVSSPAVEESGGPSRFQLLIDFLLTQYGKSDDLAELYSLIRTSVRSRDYNVQILESPIRAPRIKPAADGASIIPTSESIVDPDASELSRLFPDEISATIDIVSIPNSSAEHSKTSFDLDNPSVPQIAAAAAGQSVAPVNDSKGTFVAPKAPEKLSSILTKKKTVVNSRVSMGQSKTVSVSVRDLRHQQQQQVIRRASTVPDPASLQSPPRASSKLNSGSPSEVMNTPFSPGVAGTMGSQGRTTRRRVEDTPLDLQGHRSQGNSVGGESGRRSKPRTVPLFGDMVSSPILGDGGSTPSNAGIIADTPVFAGRSASQSVEPLMDRLSGSDAGRKRTVSQFASSSSIGFSLSGEASDSESDEFASQRSLLRSSSSGSRNSETSAALDRNARAPSPEASVLNAFSMESPRPTLPPTTKRSRASSESDLGRRCSLSHQSSDDGMETVPSVPGSILSTPLPLVPKSLRHTHLKGIAESPLKDSPLAASPASASASAVESFSATRSGSIFRSPPSSLVNARSPNNAGSPELTTPTVSAAPVAVVPEFMTQDSPIVPLEAPEHSSILKAPRKRARSPDFNQNYLTASGSKVTRAQTQPSVVAASVKPPIGRRSQRK